MAESKDITILDHVLERLTSLDLRIDKLERKINYDHYMNIIYKNYDRNSYKFLQYYFYTSDYDIFDFIGRFYAIRSNSLYTIFDDKIDNFVSIAVAYVWYCTYKSKIWKKIDKIIQESYIHNEIDPDYKDCKSSYELWSTYETDFLSEFPKDLLLREKIEEYFKNYDINDTNDKYSDNNDYFMLSDNFNNLLIHKHN